MKKLLSVLLVAVSMFAHATNYYISNSGTAGNNGTSPATPWNLAKLNSSWGTIQAGDSILFHRGEVIFGSINIGKSGLSGNPIKLDAYGVGDDPEITGLSSVTAWTSVGTNQWLSTTAATSLNTLNVVAVNSVFTPIGKYPDGVNIYNVATSATGNTSITASSLSGFNFTGGTLVTRNNHWIINRSTITSHSGSTVNYTAPNSYTMTPGFGYIVQNHQSVCNLQNEWWFDATAKKVGIFSVGMPANIKVSSVDVLVPVNAFAFLTFKHLKFTGSNTATFAITSGHHITIDSCTFNFQGFNGISAQVSSSNITLTNSNVDYTNNDFINCQNAPNWVITGNTIRRTAQNAGMGGNGDGTYSVFFWIGANSLVQNNVIKQTGYVGIDFRNSNITIKKNLVDSFCNVKDDGSAIYTWTGATTQNWTERFVDSNIVLNGGGASNGTNTAFSNAYGIYMDDNSSQVTITNNTIANCGSGGLFLHAAHDLTIRNNTIYNNVLTGFYGQIMQVYPGATATDPVRDLIITQNKFISRAASQLTAYYATNETNMANWIKNPALTLTTGRIDSNYYARPINDATATNTFNMVKGSGNLTTNLAGWQSNSPGLDAHSKKSPVSISNVNDLRFEYNASNVAVVKSLDGFNYIDITGASYPGSITLQPWTSAVLIKQGVVANALPIAVAGADQAITLPTSSVTLNGSGSSDPDGTITAYSWTKISGGAATITSPTSASTTVTGLVAGTYQFQLQVTDNASATATDIVIVTVNPAPNQLPTANAGTDASITLPTNTKLLSGSGTDPDGTITGYNWRQITGAAVTLATPTNASTNANGFPTAGTYDFELKVTDNNGATDLDTVRVTVNPAPNIPPTANAGLDINITQPASSTSVSGSGNDVDGTIIAYAWTVVGKPTGAANPTLGTPSAAGTTVSNLTSIGSYTLQLQVTDNSSATATDLVVIQVNQAPNVNPTAAAGIDQSITLPTSSVTVSGSGSNDPDGTIVTYTWTKLPGSPASSSIQTPTQVQTLIGALVQGVYQFQLKVTDDRGGVGLDTVKITVNQAPNQLPTANAGINQTITLPTNSVTLSGSGTDPDGTITQYAWTKLSGGAATIASPSSASTVVNSLVAGTYQFQLQVTDDRGGTATNTVSVIVNPAPPPNQPPIANAGADKNITLPTNSITQVGSGTDADGTVVSYQWTKISGGAATIVSPTSATTNITGLVAGTYQFQLQVTDNNSATGTDLVTVIVNPRINQPPICNAGSDVTITQPATSTSVTGSASDPDGTITGTVWQQIGTTPAMVSFTSSTTLSTGITGLTTVGSYYIMLTATDNDGATTKDTLIILVNPAPNVPPVANAGADIIDTLPNPVTLTGSGTDADGTIVEYTWRQISGAPAVIVSASNKNTEITGINNGVYSFELKVKDNSGDTDVDTVTVQVETAVVPEPTLPLANAGADKKAVISWFNSTTSTTLIGAGIAGTYPVSSYSWVQISGAAATIVSPNSATPTISNLKSGTYVFRLTVTDSNGNQATDDVTVFTTKQHFIWSRGRLIVVDY